MAYTVVRTDLMSGTKQPADLVSLRVYDASAKPAAVENGTIVKLEGYEDNQREVMKAKVASSSDDLTDCVLVASPEVMYKDTEKSLDKFINVAGSIARGYVLRARNMFSVTKEAFVGGTVPTKGKAVGIGANGKIDANTGTNLGSCVAIETIGAYTYYTIKIGKNAI